MTILLATLAIVSLVINGLLHWQMRLHRRNQLRSERGTFWGNGMESFGEVFHPSSYTAVGRKLYPWWLVSTLGVIVFTLLFLHRYTGV